MQLEMRGEYWNFIYKKILVIIKQNCFGFDEYPYNGYFTMYLCIKIDEFPENIRESLTPLYYHKTGGNILDQLPWNGGITYYSYYRGLSNIEVGCDYHHAENLENFKKFDLEYVKNDAKKCVDALLKITTK